MCCSIQLLGVAAEVEADQREARSGDPCESPRHPVLSVIVPVYNEATSVDELLRRVAAVPLDLEVIVVDDGSTDGTSVVVGRWAANPRVVLLAHDSNRGKGAAVRTGLQQVRGDYTLVQDADLEYDPRDYGALIEPILSGAADAVYGSRFLQPGNRSAGLAQRLCVSLLNCLVLVFYGRRITDEATCYKAIRTELLRRMDLQCRRFEFCPEVTAKLCRLRVPIYEVPIRYHARSVAEGKKIGWRDALRAFWTLAWWRFAPFRPLPRRGATDAKESHARQEGSMS